jgi:hypothetical protein
MNREERLNLEHQRKQRMIARHNDVLIALGAPVTQLEPIKKVIDEIEVRHRGRAITACNESVSQYWLDHTKLLEDMDAARICAALPNLPPSVLFFNDDPRGYCLKVTDETIEGRALIAATNMVTDFGGYGLLMSEAYT